MLRKRLYTFIIASHGNSKVWRLSLPYPVLVTLGIFAIIGILAAGAGALQYGKMLFKVLDYEARLSENDTLRLENHNYKVKAAQLGEKIDFLEDLSHRLMVYSGMSSDKAVGGVGGNLNQPRPASSNLSQSLDTYNRQVTSLEESFRSLDNRISEGVLYEGALPKILPVRGYVTGGWGRRPDPFDPAMSENHTGIDISAPLGSKVWAPADGTVIFAGQRAGYGNIVVIDHKLGLTTRYGHLQRMTVQVGQHISRNEIIGYVGVSGRSTGPHLHYELWRRDQPINPLNFLQGVWALSGGRP